MILSVLTNYIPDLGDFFLLIISVLLGLITMLSKKQVDKMEKFMTQNTVDHMNIEKKLVDVDTWTKSIHETQIEPTLKKANENEKNLINIRGQVRDHEGRIINLEKKYK